MKTHTVTRAVVDAVEHVLNRRGILVRFDVRNELTGLIEERIKSAKKTWPAFDNEPQLDHVIGLIRDELIRATAIHGPMKSAHEGAAVVQEEFEEMWDEVKANRPDLAVAEAVQLGAMAARFVMDVGSKQENTCSTSSKT